jgi:hypothetical protein
LDQAPLLQGALDDDLDLLEVERLRDVVARALADRLDRGVGVDRPGDHHHVEVGVVLLDAAQELEAVTSRHLDVGEDEAQRPRAHDLHRLGGARGGAGRKAEGVEPFGEQLAHRQVVVDDEHLPRVVHPEPHDQSPVRMWAWSPRDAKN